MSQNKVFKFPFLYLYTIFTDEQIKQADMQDLPTEECTLYRSPQWWWWKEEGDNEKEKNFKNGCRGGGGERK